jgi:hypothetical protein
MEAMLVAFSFHFLRIGRPAADEKHGTELSNAGP